MRRVATLIVAVMLVALAAAKPKWHELEGYTFEQYRRDFKKPYGPTDKNFDIRRQSFEDNIRRIKALNSDPTMSWRAGVNMFTDMSQAEFKKFNKARRTPAEVTARAARVHHGPKKDEPVLPLSVDWRLAVPAVLTPVKHQGTCGSCWAHSATESVESQYAILTGMLASLSVAQINSCTPAELGCLGCDGGTATVAWSYLANKSVVRPEVLKSLTEEWAYPIPVQDFFFDDQATNYSTSACADTSLNWKTPTTAWFAELTAVGVSGFGHVDSNSADGSKALMKALRDVGPQSIGVAAGNWQWYESGVMQNTNSSGTDNEWSVDHDVQMVGYGYDKVLDLNYWIVRNSWSTLWGEDGFVRLWRSKDGQPEPCFTADNVTVCGTSACISDVHYPIVYKATPTKFG